MKKLIATALAAGALTAGGAASAQDFGSVIADILGFGSPTYSQSAPAVAGQVYADQHGRQFYYDQYGRQVFVQNTQQQIVGYDSWGRPVYGGQQVYGAQQAQRITGYDSWGRPIHGQAGVYAGSAYGGSGWDRDGDGVANARDRWPDDARYR